MKNYDYGSDLDILYIYNNFENEEVEGNIVFENIVVDVGKTGKVLGVEIDCASKLFNFPSDQLNNLKLAKIQVMKIGNMLTLGIVLATQVKEHTFQFAISQEADKIPIVAN